MTSSNLNCLFCNNVFHWKGPIGPNMSSKIYNILHFASISHFYNFRHSTQNVVIYNILRCYNILRGDMAVLHSQTRRHMIKTHKIIKVSDVRGCVNFFYMFKEIRKYTVFNVLTSCLLQKLDSILKNK